MTEELKKEFSKLRFLDENGDLYACWQEQKLIKIAQIEKGKQINKTALSPFKSHEMSVPVINGGISFSGWTNKENRIGRNISISEGGASAGFTQMVGFPFWSGGHNYSINEKSTKGINIDYLFQFLKGNQDKLMDSKVGSGLPNLQKSTLSNFEIKIPSLPEQEKIANLLSKMDERIELEAKLIELRKKEKQGYMQRILGGGGEYRSLRFKKDDGTDYPDWTEVKLGDVLIEYNKRTKSNNEYPAISSSRQGVLLQEEYFKKQVASEKNIGYKIIPRGYATYRAMSDTREFTFNIQNIIENGIVSPAYPVFFSNNENDLLYLISTMNNSFIFIKELNKVLQGGTRNALPFSKLKEITVLLPCLPEQEKIAEFLTGLDNRIEKELNKLEELKLEKQGYMQRVLG